jgi:hypothetical protein
MNDSLRLLVRVRELHLARLEADHQAARQRLEYARQQLREVDDELAVLREQRAAWEQQWQHWLQHDGVLCRGQTYNLRHLNLAAWEGDISDRRTQLATARDAAEAAFATALRALQRAQVRISRLRDAAHEANRRHLNRTATHADANRAEETLSHTWTLHHGPALHAGK